MTIQGFPSPGPGLRLHLNENTAGCSPAVVDAIRRLTADDIAAYPDYRAAVEACAGHFGVDPDWVLLTNGLDEGILMLAIGHIAKMRLSEAAAIVPVPAFDPYFSALAAVGADAVRVPPGEDFAFPTAAVIAAITPATRLVFLNTPNNPSGRVTPRADIEQVASAATPALVFVDEAYVEFAGGSFLEALPRHRNVVVGRTFSKAYGLAGLRIGCLIAHPEALAPIRAVTPLLNLNAVATAALQAAIADRDFIDQYRACVATSRQMLAAACTRLGLQYWDSAANFLLVRVGPRAAEIVTALSAQGVHVRDRSRDPYTPGCIRITTGVIEHTEAAIRALEAVATEAAR